MGPTPPGGAGPFAMSTAPLSPLPIRSPEQLQALRLRRFGMASSTYALGLSILAVCWHLGRFPGPALVWVTVLFGLINLGLLTVFASGWNERAPDPSLTAAQVCLGVTMVAVILVLGRELQFVAAPFYSVLFVFGMLRLSGRELAGVAVYVLTSYFAAVLLRFHLYADGLDHRVEFVGMALVVGSSVWFATAASYISRLRARLRASIQQVGALAAQDPLTGLANRRQIDLELEAAVAHARRHRLPLCVAVVDVDHFKAVNDRHGHAVGDEVLRRLAHCLASALRAGDHLGRFGGEEFLLVLPATPLAQAGLMAERLRAQVEALRPLPAADPAVTASFGLAGLGDGEHLSDLLRRADRALYRAKDAGRNRVEIAPAAG